MIRNYFKIAWRNLIQNIGYTTIKVLGLSVGISCCILIMLFVSSEWSYDRFHNKADRLYRVWQDEKYEDQAFVNTITPIVLAPTLDNNIPEIEKSCRLISLNPTVTIDEQDFTENVLMADNTFFEMFDFDIVKGNSKNPFHNTNALILSESTAKRLYGNENALGKNLELTLGDEKKLFTVSGIMRDAPEASSIQFNMLILYNNVNDIYSERAQNSWFNVFGETYVLLPEGTLPEKLYPKFSDMMKTALGENYTPGGFELYLQPITDIHLNNSLPNGIQPTSDPKYSYILATIGILILLIACANFIILAIGHSTSRAREVGVRKVMGAERPELIRQFMGEALIITTISLVLGLVLSWLFLGPFNQIIDKDLSIPTNLTFALFCIGLALLIAFIAGYYPAIVLSKFNPVTVLKGNVSTNGGSGFFRQSLVVGQFAASIAMIICTLIIGQQIYYFQSKDLGYDREQMIIVPTNLNREDGFVLAERYKTALSKYPEVLNASVSLYSFAEPSWVTLGFTNEKKEYKSFQYNAVDTKFFETMDISMSSGRPFDNQITSDESNAAIVNESFVKEFGMQDPIGKRLPGQFGYEIVGVVKDFNFQSLHNPVAPLLLTMKPDSIFRRTENIGMSAAPQPRMVVKMKSGSISKNVEVLKSAWKEVAPNQDFVNIFLDESIKTQYKAEVRTNTIVKIASSLAIFIAIMGLFGLVTLIIARRKKEIGIRKVLGAKASSIVAMLSLDFAKLIIIASFIAFPLAWWFMNDWLKDFAYKIDIKWWVFVIAATSALVIALLTISIQALKAAWSNPTKSLRTE